AEKEHHLGDLVDLAPAAEGDVAAHLRIWGIWGIWVIRPRRREALHALGAFDRAGDDAVHPDARRRPFEGEVAGQLLDTGFGGAGVDLQRRGHERLRGADVDDAALLRGERLVGGAARVEGAAEVDVDDGAKAVRRERRRRRKEVPGRRADED